MNERNIQGKDRVVNCSHIPAYSHVDQTLIFSYYEAKIYIFFMKRFELILLFLHVPIDFVLLLLAATSAYVLRASDLLVGVKPILFDITFSEYFSIALWVSVAWIAIFALAGLYSPAASRRFATDMVRIFLATATGLAGIALYMLFTQQLFDSRFLVAASWAFALIYVILGRLVVRGIKGLCYRAGIGLRSLVIIGDDSIASELESVLKTRKELGRHVIARFSHFSPDAQKYMDGVSIDEVLMTNPRGNEEETLKLLDYVQSRHIAFHYSADLFATIAANTSVHPLAGIPIVEIKPTRLEGWGRILKRFFDIVLSVIVLVVGAPFFLVIALGILIETGRPVIYKNERVGVRRKHFFLYKFRSMYQSDSTGVQFGASGEAALKKEAALIKKQNGRKGPIYKVHNDPRVTRFGRFLRRWSLDEFPQFWNVLCGTMSVVGPRPHQPREVSLYEKKHGLAFNVKPGITGLSQISGRSDLSYEEEMRLDILYIEKWSLWLDVIIVVKTPFLLFKKRKVE